MYRLALLVGVLATHGCGEGGGAEPQTEGAPEAAPGTAGGAPPEAEGLRAGSSNTPPEEAAAGSKGEMPEDDGKTRGAVSFFVADSPNCPVGGQWWDYPRDQKERPVSADSFGPLARDRTRNSSGLMWRLSCAMGTTEPPYWITAQMGASSQDIGAVDVGYGLSITIPLDSAGPTQLGTFLFHADNTASTFRVNGEPKCESTFIAVDVAKGTAWGAFSCPRVVEDDAECEITEGYFYFENCWP